MSSTPKVEPFNFPSSIALFPKMKSSKFDHLSEPELQFLLEAKEVVKKKPEWLRGRFRAWKNLFPKPRRVTFIEFKKLLENLPQKAFQ